MGPDFMASSLLYNAVRKNAWKKQRKQKVPSVMKGLKSYFDRWPSTVREVQCLGYGLKVVSQKAKRDSNPGCSQRRKTATLDCSQAMNRLHIQIDSVTCVVPGARFVVVELDEEDQPNLDTMRPIFGLEKLALQGLTPEIIEAMCGDGSLWKLFADWPLGDMAGNSFSTAHLSVPYSTALSVFKFPSSEGEVAKLRRLARKVMRKSHDKVKEIIESMIKYEEAMELEKENEKKEKKKKMTQKNDRQRKKGKESN